MDNNDISSLLSSVMSDPELMAKLMNTAKNISSNRDDPIPGEAKEVATSAPKPQSSDAMNRTRLIAALKPYLNEERRDKADKLLGLLSLLEVTQATGLFKKQ